MSRFKKFLALSGADKITFVVAVCGLPGVYLNLRRFGFKNYLARLQHIPLAEIPPDIETSSVPAQISYLVNAAARLLFRREACLERSILLWSLLRRRGIESELKIGVANEDSSMRAHAWVEIDGAPINEQPQLREQFTAFDSAFTREYRDFS